MGLREGKKGNNKAVSSNNGSARHGGNRSNDGNDGSFGSASKSDSRNNRGWERPSNMDREAIQAVKGGGSNYGGKGESAIGDHRKNGIGNESIKNHGMGKAQLNTLRKNGGSRFEVLAANNCVDTDSVPING
ncbi:hypothetical protein ACOSP7_016870 [Xanthoceras sorbifolium]